MTIITGDRLHTTQLQRDAAYLHLIDIVINGDRYLPATTCFSTFNAHFYGFLQSFTINPWFARKSAIEQEIENERLRFNFDLMIAWITRLYNMHGYVFPIVLLSLWALKCDVNKPFWIAMQKRLLLYNKDVTTTLALDVARMVNWVMNMIPSTFSKFCSKDIVTVCFDNCQIYWKSKFEGCRVDGGGNFFYIFITWFVCTIYSSTIPATYNTDGNFPR